MNDKLSKAKYTPECHQEAVRQVRAGRTIGEVARTLGMPKASLANWGRAAEKDKTAPASVVRPASTPVVTAEQAQIARLRAEVARLKMERDIAKEAAAYFAQDVLQGTPGSNG